MSQESQNFIRKFLIVVFTVIFIAVAILISLSLIKPSEKTVVISKVLPHPISIVWSSLIDRTHYLNSKKEIEKYVIYDTILPRWTEFYSRQDSIENKTVIVKKNRCYTYVSYNRKYEQINGFIIQLDSLSPQSTNMTVKENSIFFNNWANIYFHIFKPKAIASFEILKVENTIAYMNNKLNKL